MARRSSLTTEDLGVISEALTKRIEAEIASKEIDSLAPLFRVREKILSMSEPNGQADTPKIRKARTPRTTQPERAEA